MNKKSGKCFHFHLLNDRPEVAFNEPGCCPTTIEVYGAKTILAPLHCPAEPKQLIAYGFDVRWCADAQRQRLLHRGSLYQLTLNTTTTLYITQSVFDTESRQCR